MRRAFRFVAIVVGILEVLMPLRRLKSRGVSVL